MAPYSWQRHLIAHGAYSDWVDRGRLRPTHREWTAYLREVAEKAEAEVVAGEATGLDVDGERWGLTLEAGEAISADGVVLTGAGPPVRVAGQPQRHPRVSDGRNYWLHERALGEHVAQSVCVIGSGETAASVVIQPAEEGAQALDDERRADPAGSRQTSASSSVPSSSSCTIKTGTRAWLRT
jgi:mycobactin lysine-N-oxygenase